jgi:DNA-3-methyladenine glycosylase II
VNIIRNDADVEAGLRELLLLDPRLVPVSELAGPLPLRLATPGFAGLASIIVSQMVSRASADAIWRRIEAAGPVTAELYVALDPAVIATFGLSRAKAATLKGLAEVVMRGDIDLQAICRLDAGKAMGRLVALPGIGPWTAEVYLMFCGGHADIFPAGDVALRAAIGKALFLDERPNAREVVAIAERWAPFRSVAARLFWAHYAATMRREVIAIA